jgi:hypothetical protein
MLLITIAITLIITLPLAALALLERWVDRHIEIEKQKKP